MFKSLRYRRWMKKLNKKAEGQFEAEIFEAAKRVLEKGLLNKSLNPSDPESQVLMTGALFTVLAGRMEIPVEDLFAEVSKTDPKAAFNRDNRGYL